MLTQFYFQKFCQLIFQFHTYSDHPRDSFILVVYHDSESLLCTLVCVDHQYRRERGAQEAGQADHTPPGLQTAEDEVRIVEGEVEAAHEQGEDDRGRLANDYHGGKLGGVKEDGSRTSDGHHQ